MPKRSKNSPQAAVGTENPLFCTLPPDAGVDVVGTPLTMAGINEGLSVF